MGLDGVLGHHQVGGDLAVAEPFADQPQYVQLARCQFGQPVRVSGVDALGSAVGAVAADDAAGDARAQRAVAAGGGADAGEQFLVGAAFE
nr:hypothetical protein [Actinomadura verrucosospora]